ncbi:MAG TPA: FAD-linked oxidase C-terminal domain-containing protein [Bryobacteraceae bacterium]|nr:FAD-linked oxidase C-terminal domain-containing protein [Bryobacteraceae bacterium]
MNQAVERELKASIEGEVRFDKISRALYSNDASVYQIEPTGIVIPRHRDDLIRTLEICRRFRCPITMRGGGTSQAGQAIGEGVIVDTSKYFHRLLEVNAEDRWARVEPGIVLDELNAHLAAFGLRFAPDISTASRATIGGMMANNSSGARSVLYGKTIDHVLEQVVMLSDGSIAHFREIQRDEIPDDESLEASCYRTVLRLASEHADEIERRYPKVLRRVGGYNLDEFVDKSRPVNLAKIMVGSEGTLGVVLEAKLRLVPLPKAKAVMVIEFADLLEALSAAPVILRHNPSAIEVMDKAILDNTRQNAALDQIRKSFIEGDPGATLCVEFYADRKEDLPPRLRALEENLRASKLGYRYRNETDQAAQARIWSLREAALGLSMAMKEDAKSIPFVEDTAVAPERLSEYIAKFLAILRAHETTAGIYAHASVGCLHVRPVINMKTESGVRKFEAIANEVAELVLEYGGALSGEHGDGLVRSPFLKKMFGDAIYQAFREIKQTFDPEGIFNPGKIVNAPPMTSNLRFGAHYNARNPKTFFDFAEYGGFAGAVEMCSGVGACRKKLAGNMCPSYMATREESDSTRGRANVLRLAISGRLDEAGLGDQGVFRVLDLCLECRACKTECPVGVDMARFKSEFLADYYSRHGTPLQARVLGNIDRLSKWGSRFAPWSNRMPAPFIDSRRKLPPWKRETFARWAANHKRSRGRAVTLFSDTFTNHYEPEIGAAAVEILERCGCDVNVARPACCGRPLISQGLLDRARTTATVLVEALFPIAERGEKILFCEPSCLSAVREDAPSLLRDELARKAGVVAGACMLFEEFAAKLDLPLRAGPERILLHAHCHQKSMGMQESTRTLLSRIPSAKVVDLDAGCCGMAGSFGYTHYDVSVAIANGRLIPAVKAMKPGEVLVAPGTSCRRQVADLAQAGALHPATLIRSLLG